MFAAVSARQRSALAVRLRPLPRLLVGSLMLWWAPAMAPMAAELSEEVRSRMAECLAMADSDQRLACLEFEAGRIVTDQNTARTAIDPGDPQTTFGKPPVSQKPGPRPREPDRIHSIIDRVEQRPHGERVFHLDNGQVWTEVEVGWSHYQAGMAVDIARTLMGSYLLSTEDGRVTRVRRLD